MANAIGLRYLIRFYEGTATLAQLDYCLARGYITLAEYDRAMEGLPPLGYTPRSTTASESEQPPTT